MDSKSSFDAYRMPDAMWENIQPLLPAYKTSSFGGRPRRDLRSVADAIFYRLRTGCQWNAIPACLAPGSTAHAYFQEWVELGVFATLWGIALELYDDLVGLDWRWQSVDGAMTKAPLGGESTGKTQRIVQNREPSDR
jgi:putative transposase